MKDVMFKSFDYDRLLVHLALFPTSEVEIWPKVLTNLHNTARKNPKKLLSDEDQHGENNNIRSRNDDLTRFNCCRGTFERLLMN